MRDGLSMRPGNAMARLTIIAASAFVLTGLAMPSSPVWACDERYAWTCETSSSPAADEPSDADANAALSIQSDGRPDPASLNRTDGPNAPTSRRGHDAHSSSHVSRKNEKSPPHPTEASDDDKPPNVAPAVSPLWQSTVDANASAAVPATRTISPEEMKEIDRAAGLAPGEAARPAANDRPVSKAGPEAPQIRSREARKFTPSDRDASKPKWLAWLFVAWGGMLTAGSVVRLFV